MAIGFYIRAILRHWIALMGGVIAVAVAIGITFKLVPGWVQTDPLGFWLVGAVSLATAGYLAWNDEFTSRLRAEEERDGPALSLQLLAGNSHTALRRGQHRWVVTNSGADAFNVTSDPIGGIAPPVRIEEIDRVPRGGSITLRFHGVSLEQVYERMNGVHRVCLTYKGVSGRLFETECRVRWEPVSRTGSVEHVACRRALSPRRSPWRRWITRRGQDT